MPEIDTIGGTGMSASESEREVGADDMSAFWPPLLVRASRAQFIGMSAALIQFKNTAYLGHRVPEPDLCTIGAVVFFLYGITATAASVRDNAA